MKLLRSVFWAKDAQVSRPHTKHRQLSDETSPLTPGLCLHFAPTTRSAVKRDNSTLPACALNRNRHQHVHGILVQISHLIEHGREFELQKAPNAKTRVLVSGWVGFSQKGCFGFLFFRTVLSDLLDDNHRNRVQLRLLGKVAPV